MSLLDNILEQNQWIGFYEHLADAGRISHGREYDFFKFIRDREYSTIGESILNGESLPYPTKQQISKVDSQKKRTVYTYGRKENYILKFVAHLLSRHYDHIFSDNLYSFRVGTGAKRAIRRIIRIPNIDQYYSYKVDISDYFNSINIDRLLVRLQDILKDDPQLLALLRSMLKTPYVLDNGEVVEEKKGVMAGTPTAGFLANIYLIDLDEYFAQRGIIYCRYSDDIIVFAKSMNELMEHKQIITSHLEQHGLNINHSKEVITAPNQEWTYLGFAYHNGNIDISETALNKLKGKMRRKSRALYRWRLAKNKSAEMGTRAFIKRFNNKLFYTLNSHETNWTQWYFPLITTDERLKMVDSYMLECIRYIASGRHTKSNFNFRYEQIKQLGYRSLVHSWHEWQHGRLNFSLDSYKAMLSQHPKKEQLGNQTGENR